MNSIFVTCFADIVILAIIAMISWTYYRLSIAIITDVILMDLNCVVYLID